MKKPHPLAKKKTERFGGITIKEVITDDPLAKKPQTHFKVRHTGMVITAATRDRWERQQLARALEEFPDLPKGPKRPRLNSRRKRRRRNQAPPIVVDEFVDPILRTFVNKKRRARSKKNRQE